MSALAQILTVSAGGTIAALALWIWLAGQLVARIHSRLRALPLCLPLLLAAVVYGLYWVAFFASPEGAVQMHAIRLTLSHVVGPALPWLAGLWVIVSGLALAPLLRR